MLKMEKEDEPHLPTNTNTPHTRRVCFERLFREEGSLREKSLERGRFEGEVASLRQRSLCFERKRERETERGRFERD